MCCSAAKVAESITRKLQVIWQNRHVSQQSLMQLVKALHSSVLSTQDA